MSEGGASRGGGGGGGGNSRGKSRGGNRSGGRGGRGGGSGGNKSQGSNKKGGQDASSSSGLSSAERALAAMEKARQAAAAAAAAAAAQSNGSGNGNGGEDEEVCFICANPVAHHSVSSCNHRTCHICGLRMRALYKSKDCAHCRTSSPFVIFTDDAEKRFEQYTPSDFTSTDDTIGIKYAKEGIVDDTILLLRYNCPDDACDFAGLGWSDLHRHVKSAHKKRLCDLCTRHKKVFTHEHELFSDKELDRHMRRGDDKPGAADQTGFKGHPLCGFCGERFYDDDKLYEHCRMKHERCFLCDRRNSREPHYFLNYEELEKHFKRDHFLCYDRACLEKKFVVFESELDLQVHQVTEHADKGGAGRDARLVNMSTFADIRQPFQEESGAGGGRSSRRGGRSARGRDPNIDDHMLPTTTTTTTTVPLRRDEIAFQRQMAIHSAPQGSTRTFRGQLSSTSTGPATTTPSPAPPPSSSRTAPPPPNRPRSAEGSSSASPSASASLITPLETLTISNTTALTPTDRARLVRHSSVIERAANLLGNNPHKMSTFRTHISSYRQGGLDASQLIDAFFTLFADASSHALGTLVRELAELFDDKDKADTLRKTWQDWRAIHEDYPTLPGAQAVSASAWVNAAAANPSSPAGGAAAAASGSSRVLKLKNSTRLGGPGPAPTPTTSHILPGWVASTSTSTSFSSSSSSSRPPPASAFPSLPPAAKSTSTTTSSSPPAVLESPSRPRSQAAPSTRPPPNTRNQEAFPALPAAPKPQTTIFGYGSGRGVRRDWGQQESGFQWGVSTTSNTNTNAGPSSSTTTTTATNATEGEEETKGKRGKKGKKVIVQWG